MSTVLVKFDVPLHSSVAVDSGGVPPAAKAAVAVPAGPTLPLAVFKSDVTQPIVTGKHQT